MIATVTHITTFTIPRPNLINYMSLSWKKVSHLIRINKFYYGLKNAPAANHCQLVVQSNKTALLIILLVVSGNKKRLFIKGDYQGQSKILKPRPVNLFPSVLV